MLASLCYYYGIVSQYNIMFMYYNFLRSFLTEYVKYYLLYLYSIVIV